METPELEPHEIYKIADLTVDVGAARCQRGAVLVELPALSFDLLVCLIRRAPNVVTVDELVETVWKATAVSDETVVQRIALLRKALQDNSSDPRYVRSVRGKGYQLIPELRRENGRTQRERARPWVLAVAVLTVLVGGGLWALRSPPFADLPDPQTADPSVEQLVRRGREYLARHREDDNERAVQLFQQALEASPDDLDALTGLSLAFSHRVSKFNQPETWAGEAEKLAERALALDGRSAEAYHALAMARDSRAEIGPALAAYRRAVELDPEHAGALSSAGYLLYIHGDLAEALEWSLRALELGADLPYGEIQIALTLATLELDRAAEPWFEKALALRPDNLFAYSAYASFRLAEGQLDSALALVDRALAADVERPELYLIRSTAALLTGDRAAARATAAEAVERFPESSAARHRLLLLDGPESPEYTAAVRQIAAAREAGDEWPELTLAKAMLHSVAGEPAAALAALDEAVRLGYRNADWLLLEPMLEGLRRDPGFWSRIERLRELVAEEREAVLNAPWLPPDLLVQVPGER